MRNIDPIKAEEDFRAELRVRFNKKTEPSNSGCIEWTGTTNREGYGSFWCGNELKMQKAHRVAWWLECGEWPTPCALHKCDNPSCVRVDHLFEGTIADNVSDMMAKKRNRYVTGDKHWSRLHPERRAYGSRNGMNTHPGIKAGILNGRALLTFEKVEEMRRLRNNGMAQKDLAEMFGVSRQTVGYACAGKTWSSPCK